MAQRAQDTRFYQAKIDAQRKLVPANRQAAYYKKKKALRRYAPESVREAERFRQEQNHRISEERKRRREANRQKIATNKELNIQRELARNRRDSFLQKWTKIYGHLFMSQKRIRKVAKDRREKRERATSEKGVYAHIRRINTGSVRCHWCLTCLPNGGHADHVVPLSKGGRHIVANIVPSCEPCNTIKRDFMPDDERSGVKQLNLAMT